MVVVVDYPTPSEGWGHGGRPWSPRSWATSQGLDRRSYRDRESRKSEQHKVSAGASGRILDSVYPREIELNSRLCPLQRRREKTQQA